jgi:pimeloyl-ACP methyl ester carboxylesterase
VPAAVPGAKPVSVEHIKVHGKSLQGNLGGDAVERDVVVSLPRSHQRDKHRRYPVVYSLHGYSIGAEQWTHEIHVPQTIEGAFAQGAKEMIVVLPDSKTLHNGSMYSRSVTTEDFERFIAHDLVAYIDAHYRTIAERVGRGLVGHSMGGYGATRIGMKHADVFGSLYMMSPCCLSPRPTPSPEGDKALEAVNPPEDSANLSFLARATLATAAAWSSDPKNPPLYLDLPTKGSEPQPDVLVKWAANAPMRRWHSWINTSGRFANIVQSRWMWATRTAYASIPPSFMMFLRNMESRIASRCTRGPIPAGSPIASKITCCRSSATISAFKRVARKPPLSIERCENRSSTQYRIIQ